MTAREIEEQGRTVRCKFVAGDSMGRRCLFSFLAAAFFSAHILSSYHKTFKVSNHSSKKIERPRKNYLGIEHQRRRFHRPSKEILSSLKTRILRNIGKGWFQVCGKKSVHIPPARRAKLKQLHSSSWKPSVRSFCLKKRKLSLLNEVKQSCRTNFSAPTFFSRWCFETITPTWFFLKSLVAFFFSNS